jgi:hypothetical protein
MRGLDSAAAGFQSADRCLQSTLVLRLELRSVKPKSEDSTGLVLQEVTQPINVGVAGIGKVSGP